jgi:enamine deaminase RidA (YjgF/YER057c/UK114 family)
VVKSGDFVYIAGQVARDEQGNVVGKDDFKAQAEQVFQNLQKCLASAGASFKDVVKTNVYLVSYSNIPQYREARSKYFPGDPPASTLVIIPSLALREFLLEVEAIAYVGK